MKKTNIIKKENHIIKDISKPDKDYLKYYSINENFDLFETHYQDFKYPKEPENYIDFLEPLSLLESKHNIIKGFCQHQNKLNKFVGGFKVKISRLQYYNFCIINFYNNKRVIIIKDNMIIFYYYNNNDNKYHKEEYVFTKDNILNLLELLPYYYVNEKSRGE